MRPELPNPVTLPRSPDLAPAMPFEASDPQAASGLGEDTQPPRLRPAPRAPIDSTLPPDYPLEPGARNQTKSAAERLACSEPADAAPASGEGSSKSNFIAAARRAAQAAAAANVEKSGRLTAATDAARSAVTKAGLSIRTARSSSDASKPSRTRPLLVGVSVVLIVLSGFRLAMNFLDGGESAPPPAEKSSVTAPAPDAAPPGDTRQKSDAAPTSYPLLTSPTAVERQTLIGPPPGAPVIPADVTQKANSAAAAPAPAPAPAPVPEANDVTGSIASQPAASREPAPTNDISADKLPDSLAGPALRAAASRGEPAAAFEIAVRYAEGRGVAANYGEAAKWYERAAQNGIVPAMFRLGTILEKGLNGKKDIDAARRYYVLAAERGNAKAMHNLAVLDADGGGKGPNYKSAAVWFRKAADHGVADSEYNLGILYARGIGVEQNLAESFKWFSLAAAQGDSDAARKREDVVKRLDPQSLAAAKLAIQTFTPEPQPDDAINVAAPAGGWDSAAVPKQAVKPAAKPAKQRAAAR